MNEDQFSRINAYAKNLGLELYATELASYCNENSFSCDNMDKIEGLFKLLSNKKDESAVNTLLKLSRLPLKTPKTFEDFDFGRLHGKNTDKLESLKTLAPIYAHRNLAFIGPHGLGKTHLSMAFGRACCQKGLKTYFLKANELNERLSEARRLDRTGTVINSLVKPSCLIIDEVGRCVFDKENTRLFFDLVDRRYSKEGPSSIIFTSNESPDKWGEFFSEDSSLLCALDRIFDDAIVFLLKGESYRGSRMETVALETNKLK